MQYLIAGIREQY